MKTYNQETALIDMLMSQLEFQRKLLTKRNILAPDDVKVDIVKKFEEACYHATCTNVELAEVIEQLKIDKQEITQEVLFEITDAFTFLLNQLLYCNFLPTKTLNYYYNMAKERFKANSSISYTEIIGLYNIANGALYHETRYKSWKTYSELSDNTYQFIQLLDEMLIIFMMLYVKAKVQVDEIYTLYYQKNKINIERQQTGGKYE